MPEKEYIEREALMTEINRIGGHNLCEWSTIGVKALVERQPTADVAEVKHGYWEHTEYGYCSVCKRSISEIYDADSSMSVGILDELTFCPFCGAKMDGKEKKQCHT